ELRVQQNLLSKAGMKEVRRVYSHAQSLAQCNAWLAQNLPSAERIPAGSNAEAAQRAAREEGAAAVAGEAAGERYGLTVLARSIEDSPNNTTRFLVLGELDAGPTGKDRTSIAPYQPGKPISELAREMGLDEAGIVKLASNENPRGIGPRTRAAIDAALADIARYPDGNGFELKHALATRYGVDTPSIVLGNGSNDVLELVALAFLGPGRAAVMSQHAFAVYPLATQALGARSIVVPAADYGHDLEAMIRAVDDETYLIWVANPNHPTGTFARPDEVEAFLRRAPERVLVVMDEAYNEYLSADLRGDSVKWLRRHPNLT